MQLQFRVARENHAGESQTVLEGTHEFDDPLLKQVGIHVGFLPEITAMGRTNYDFGCHAILSFKDDIQLNDEHCDIRGIISSFPPNTKTYRGGVTYVTYPNLPTQGFLNPTKCMKCRFGGQMQLPGPVFQSNPPQLPADLIMIQPTLQHQQNWAILFDYGYKMVEAAAYFVIDAEGWH